MRSTLAAAMAVVLSTTGCSGESGAPSAKPAPEQDPGSAAATTVTPVELGIERVDAIHYVLGEDAVLHLAANAAAGTLSVSLGADGIVLEALPADGALAQLGLRAGDIVTSLNGAPVAVFSALRPRYQASLGLGYVVIELSRGGQPSTINVHWREGLSLGDRQRKPGWDDADKQLSAAVATGIRKTSDDTYEIDTLILKALAAESKLIDRCGARSERGSVAGVSIVGGPNICTALGIGPYDLIKMVNGIDTSSAFTLREALGGLAAAKKFTISIARFNEAKLLAFEVVTDLVMDAQLDQAVAAVAGIKVGLDSDYTSDSTSSKGVSSSSTGGHAGVRQLDPRTFEADREVVLKVLDNPTKRHLGRAVPNVRNGERNGLKIFALRPSAILTAAGIRNGDTIIEVAGIVLNSAEALERLATSLRTAKSARVSIQRRGKPLELTIKIRD